MLKKKLLLFLFCLAAATSVLTVVVVRAEQQEQRVVVSSTTPAAATAGGTPSSCPTTSTSLNESFDKYHSDRVCNRYHYDSYKRSLGKRKKHLHFKAGSGNYRYVPNQKTVICPSTVHSLYMPNQQIGFDTSWIVENTASRPVVLAFVHGQTGIEASALTSTIRPPESDPKAILKPGEWKHGKFRECCFASSWLDLSQRPFLF